MLLQITGWIISFYFYQVHNKKIPDNIFWMPKILRMTDCRCDEIVDTKFGKTFGKSNAFWGLLYYVCFFIAIIAQWYIGKPGIDYLFIVALLSFSYSIYLAWGLYILRVICRPCLGIHTVNAIVFVILLVYVWPLLLLS